MSLRRGLTDNLSVRRGLTGNLSFRRPLTNNLSFRKSLTGNLSVRRPLTDNLSIRRSLTDNLSVRRGLTDSLSVRRSLTDNLSVRRSLSDNLSVRWGLTDNFSDTVSLLRKGSRGYLSDKQITSIAMDTALMKKRDTKHCSWRLFKSDSCYPESIPEGTHFIRFANVGKVKEGMTEWQKNKQSGQTGSKKVGAFMWQKRFYDLQG